MTTSKTSSNENKTGSDNLTDYGVWLKIFALIIPFIAVTSSAFYGFRDTYGEYQYVAEENGLGVYALWVVFNTAAIAYLLRSRTKSLITYITAIIFGLVPIVLDEVLVESQATVFDYIGTERGGLVFGIIIASFIVGTVIILLLNPALSALAYIPSIILIWIYRENMRYPLDIRELITVTVIFAFMSTVAGFYSNRGKEKVESRIATFKVRKYDLYGLFLAYNMILFLVKFGRKYENGIITNLVEWMRGSAEIYVGGFETLIILLVAGICFAFLCKEDYKYVHAALTAGTLILFYFMSSGFVNILALFIFTVVAGGFAIFCTMEEKINICYVVCGFILTSAVSYILQQMLELGMHFSLAILLIGFSVIEIFYKGKVDYEGYKGTLILGLYGTFTMIAVRYDIRGMLPYTAYDGAKPTYTVYDNAAPSVVVVVLCMLAAIFFWAIAAYLLKPGNFKVSANMDCAEELWRFFVRIILLALPVVVILISFLNLNASAGF